MPDSFNSRAPLGGRAEKMGGITPAFLSFFDRKGLEGMAKKVRRGFKNCPTSEETRRGGSAAKDAATAAVLTPTGSFLTAATAAAKKEAAPLSEGRAGNQRAPARPKAF